MAAFDDAVRELSQLKSSIEEKQKKVSTKLQAIEKERMDSEELEALVSQEKENLHALERLYADASSVISAREAYVSSAKAGAKPVSVKDILSKTKEEDFNENIGIIENLITEKKYLFLAKKNVENAINQSENLLIKIDSGKTEANVALPMVTQLVENLNQSIKDNQAKLRNKMKSLTMSQGMDELTLSGINKDIQASDVKNKEAEKMIGCLNNVMKSINERISIQRNRIKSGGVMPSMGEIEKLHKEIENMIGKIKLENGSMNIENATKGLSAYGLDDLISEIEKRNSKVNHFLQEALAKKPQSSHEAQPEKEKPKIEKGLEEKKKQLESLIQRIESTIVMEGRFSLGSNARRDSWSKEKNIKYDEIKKMQEIISDIKKESGENTLKTIQDYDNAINRVKTQRDVTIEASRNAQKSFFKSKVATALEKTKQDKEIEPEKKSIIGRFRRS